jgi:hypothetical protein
MRVRFLQRTGREQVAMDPLPGIPTTMILAKQDQNPCVLS